MVIKYETRFSLFNQQVYRMEFSIITTKLKTTPITRGCFYVEILLLHVYLEEYLRRLGARDRVIRPEHQTTIVGGLSVNDTK